MTYSEKLKDPRWQRKRLEIMQRDEFACCDCLSTDRTLHVHHCLYRKDLEPWEYRDDELRTLCEDCHADRAEAENDVKLEFARLLATRNTEEIIDMMDSILVAKQTPSGLGLVIVSRFHYEQLAPAL